MVTPKSGVRPRTSPLPTPPPGGWVALWRAGGDRAPWTPSESAGTPGLALLLPTCRARVRAQCSIARVRLRPPAQVCAAPGASRQTLAEHVPRLFARRDRTPMPRSAGVRAGAAQVCAATREQRSQRAEHARAARQHLPSTGGEGPGGARLAAHVCAASGAARSRRDKHAMCRPPVATTLPSCHRWRARAWRPMCVPPAARRARGGTSTLCAVCLSRPPSSAVA